MKKTFKMQDLDCANCASKIENQIKKLPGVHDANISFMRQRFTLDADEEAFERILDEAQRICSKIEPDTTILR